MTKGETEIDFNVFAGAETGILKAANINNKACISKNLHNLSKLTKENEITCLSYGASENEILLGLRNQTVKMYDVQFRSFSQNFEAKNGSGPLVGVCRVDGALVTASQSGAVTVWRNEHKLEINAIRTEVSSMGKKIKQEDWDEEQREKHQIKLGEGKEVCRMRQSRWSSGQVGLGGKEVELQVWDLSQPDTGPVFRSKNVAEDKLCLRQPVWISDLGWSSPSTAAICSRHGQIRLYDLRSGQRKPVSELTWPDSDDGIVNTSLACVDQQQVIVGTNTGMIGLWDFRTGQGYRGLVRKYKGSVGSVRDIATQPGNSYFCAVGLDRFLRVWRIGAGGVKPVHKLYMKSRLNSVLMTESFDPEKKTDEEEKEEDVLKDKSLDDSDDVLSDNENEIKEEQKDDLWDNMIEIGKKDQNHEVPVKRKKLK